MEKSKKISEEKGFVAAGQDTLNEYVESSQSSGSGSGLPLLVRNLPKCLLRNKFA